VLMFVRLPVVTA